MFGSREVKKNFGDLSNIFSNNLVIEYLCDFEFLNKNVLAPESGPLSRKDKQKTRRKKSCDTASLNRTVNAPANRIAAAVSSSLLSGWLTRLVTD